VGDLVYKERLEAWQQMKDVQTVYTVDPGGETPEWKGERFDDGRPRVPDEILDRMKLVTLEEAWATCRNGGFNFQYEDGWQMIHPDQVLVGRALTSVWMPGRPDILRVIEADGKAEVELRRIEQRAVSAVVNEKFVAAARINAVAPRSVRAFTLAPFSIKTFTVSVWPLCMA